MTRNNNSDNPADWYDLKCYMRDLQSIRRIVIALRATGWTMDWERWYDSHTISLDKAGEIVEFAVPPGVASDPWFDGLKQSEG